MKGKGEITNTRVNVKEINSLLPGPVCFESISIGSISINVQSFANIKVIPIRIVIKDVEAIIVERMELKIPTTENVKSGGGLNGRHKYGKLKYSIDYLATEEILFM